MQSTKLLRKISKSLTTRAAFESYTPEVTAKIIKLDSEDKAKEVLEAAKVEGADFAPNRQRQFNRYCYKRQRWRKSSLTQEQQIFHLKSRLRIKLDENGISDVITVSAGQNYSASYIVKLNKKTEKRL